MLVDLDGAEVQKLSEACRGGRVWGCFSVMERNPNGAPYNTGLIVNDRGETV